MLYAVHGVKLQNRLQTRSDLLTELQNNPDAIRCSARRRTRSRRWLSIRADGCSPWATPPGWCASRTCRAGGERPAAGARCLDPQEAMAFSPRRHARSPDREAERRRPDPGRTHEPLHDRCSDSRVRRLGSLRGVFYLRAVPGGVTRLRPAGRQSRCRFRARAGRFVPSDTLRLLDAVDRARDLAAAVSAARRATGDTAAVRPRWHAGDLGATGLHAAVERPDRTRDAALPDWGEPAISADSQTLALAVNNPDLLTANVPDRDALTCAPAAIGFLAEGVSNVWMRTFAITPDGQTIIGTTLHGDTDVWDAASGSIPYTIAAPGRACWHGPRSPGRTLLVGSQDGSRGRLRPIGFAAARHGPSSGRPPLSRAYRGVLGGKPPERLDGGHPGRRLRGPDRSAESAAGRRRFRRSTVPWRLRSPSFPTADTLVTGGEPGVSQCGMSALAWSVDHQNRRARVRGRM